ncbi:MAG: SCO family protein [Nitrospirae bacterium]|nr:SCO family protein [Magnetococcales bacterium]HAT48888.1 hypothetical protein [Alphaproteobacteria bacterium]
MRTFKNLPKGPKTALIAFLVGSVITIAVQVGYELFLERHEMPTELVGIVLPKPRGVASFQLLDHNGQTFNLERLQGKWTFMFFGYTHCPDVCPTTMGLLSDVFKRLKERHPQALAQSQGIFVSIDPKRDTKAVLKDFVPYFNQEFLGITGDEEQIQKFAKGLGVGFKLSEPEKDGSYAISHTSAIYLMDPRGRFYALFQSQFHDADRIADMFPKIIDFNSK